MKKEEVFTDASLFGSRENLNDAFKDAREMLLREVPSTSAIVVETALYIINNTIANKYKVYESDR